MQNIINYLKKEIENLELNPQQEEIGEVLEVKDGTALISGLQNVESLEIIKFKTSLRQSSEKNKTEQGDNEDLFGLALNLEENQVGSVILCDFSKIQEGDIVERTKKVLSCPVGKELIGRVVTPIGKPLDGKGEIKTEKSYPLEKIGPSVIDREPVNSPLHTGLKVVDALVPIGRGQRELILGDRITQKTSLTIDTILNQKNESNRPICIYVAVGKREGELARILHTLKKNGAMDYTIVVAATSADPAAFWYLAPYAGTAIGEYFMDQGKDALVIFDDLTKHAWAWRQISLVLKRAPGREAYPGDIFYLHSRLLERAGKLNKEKGGGSLTALPIIETQAGDITAYIPTNVISICDGQIFMDTSLYLKGQRPEMNVGLSVSRVGSAAQTKAIKKVAGTLKLELAQFQELESFLEFAEEVDTETQKRIERGKRMKEILKQDTLSPLNFEKQTAIIFAGVKGLLDEAKVEDIKKIEKDLFEYIETQKPEIFKKIRETGDLDSGTEIELEKIIKEVLKIYVSKGN
jgi:F-type H+-transporting ATPase subunit alpha